MMRHIHLSRLNDKLLIAIGVILVLAGVSVSVAACRRHSLRRAHQASISSTAIDLLQQNWQYMDGVTKSDKGLAVTATDPRIVEQDGSGGQPNPAVNLYGTHLKTTGDFSVTAHLTNLGGGTASLQLYDTPPIIADEFRIEPAGVSISLHGTKLTVKGYSGSAQQDVTNPQPSFSGDADVDPTGDITLTRAGSGLSVQSGTATVTIPDGAGWFRSGAVWLGLNSPDTGFSVDKFTAQGVDGGNVSPVDTTQTPAANTNTVTGLQALATTVRPGFKVGAAAALTPWMSDPTYATQLQQNFGAITLENAMKPQFISPKRGVYTFETADALVALAHKNGMVVHGHTLAFSEANPAWMRNLPTATDADRQATTATLLQYVTDVMTHFKGQFDSLDVINEPLDTDQGTDLQHNIWYKAMGPDYMVRVSQLVHSIDPDVKQYVNENGAEMASDRQDALLALVRHVNAGGGFIYGVGLQAHVYDMDTDAIDGGELNRTFNRFAAAGLKVRISENDVTDDEGTAAQAAQYATVFAACLHNTNCVSYTTWGVNDRYDWFTDDDGSLQQGHDLLFDGNKSTSAYTALLATLR